MKLSPDITPQNTLYMSGAEIKRSSNLATRQKALESFYFISNLLSDFCVSAPFFYIVLRTAFNRATLVPCKMCAMFKNNFFATIWAYFHSINSVSWMFVPTPMDRTMLFMCHNYKIFKAVIGFFAVDMVDLLTIFKWPTKMFAHYQSASLNATICFCIRVISFCNINIVHNKFPSLLDCTYDDNTGWAICQEGGPI